MDKLKEIKSFKVDYLQAFDICKSKGKIILEHRQKIGDCKKVYEINNKEIELDGKIKPFVIDNNEYGTMLLVQEY